MFQTFCKYVSPIAIIFFWRDLMGSTRVLQAWSDVFFLLLWARIFAYNWAWKNVDNFFSQL